MLHDSGASRACYATFHAAAMLYENDSFKTHISVLAAFHRVYIRPGRLNAGLGKGLNQLFELRSIGDCVDIDRTSA